MISSVFLTIIATGFVIAFLHAAIPTHWLPFVLTGRAQRWTRSRTLVVTAVAALGHVTFTAILGLLVAWGGSELNEHASEWFHYVASGVLVAFGGFYLFRQLSGRGHVHLFAGADEHGAHSEEPAAPGPHGGQVADTGHGLIEVRLVPGDGAARVCLYAQAQEGGRPAPLPEPVAVQLEVLRPDGAQQRLHFAAAADHLRSTESIVGPFEFTALLDLRHDDHVHRHELVFCQHEHPGHDHGVHAPADEDEAPAPVTPRSDWAAFVTLFALLTFSPCEGFVPVFISGVGFGWAGFLALAVMLFVGTVGSMVLFTWLATLGMQRVSLGAVRRYESGILGLMLIGLGILVIFVE